MTGKKGMSMSALSALSDWEWAEAEADYRAGVPSRVLAERYGVTGNTLRRHMSRRKVRSPHGPGWGRDAAAI